MLVLRVFLSLICFLSLTWGVLIFVGPVILKSLISSYTHNQIIATSVAVTPKLDIKIGRLDYHLSNTAGLSDGRGFSRSIDISWSIFDGSPFLQVQFGPTFFANTLSADYIKVNTPSFSNIDFQKLKFNAEVDNLNIESALSSERLNFEALLNREKRLIQDVSISLPSVTSDGRYSWSSSEISAKVDEINLSLPFDQQFPIIDVAATNISNVKSKIRLANFSGLFEVAKESVEFQIRSQGSQFLGIEHPLTRITSEGSFLKSGLIKDVHLQLSQDTLEFSGNEQFRVTIDAWNVGASAYEMKVLGDLEPIDLVLDESFIGNIPAGNFEVDATIKGALSEIIAASRIKLKNANFPPIDFIGDLKVKFDESVLNFNCVEMDCEVSAFNFDYKASSDQELFVGSTTCLSPPCNLAKLSHNLKTFNTSEMFKTINELKILNPLYSFYFYALIANGDKVGNGHEIKINY